MSGLTKCLCNYTERRALLLAGCYLWFSALYNIIITEWDNKQTILFLQGQNAHTLQTEIMQDMLMVLNFACLFQMITVTFGLLPGVFFDKKRLILAWVWLHTFQLAGYTIYLLSGVVMYYILGDSTKVLLLLYGFVNILVGICACKIAYKYVRDDIPPQTIAI
jgi:hypothetical protein